MSAESHESLSMNALQTVTPLARVRDAMARACRDARRDERDVTLVAVSKTFAAADIEPIISEGQRVFGENRVQEAQDKWPALRAVHDGLQLHLIGPLQSNKARDAIALFDVIHTLDRASLCAALAKEIQKQGRHPQLFVQVNIGAEPQKAGVALNDLEAFLQSCARDYDLHVSGLMCIPPVDDAPAPYFALMQKLARRHSLAYLSMGMSADFEIAIAFGATHVRVGSAIFGHR